MVFSAGCFTESPDGSFESSARADDAAKCLAPEDAARLADQVLQYVNLERVAEGLPPVVMNSTLEDIAGDYACRMVDEGFFDHRDPGTGAGPAQRALDGEYLFYAIGENLAAGQQTPVEVMNVWMESDAHRGIILDPKWEEIGIAVRTGGAYAVYWVQEFGQPAEEEGEVETADEPASLDAELP
ncbi:MAG: CAP domain-containing protein [Planctomycetota bacterium]